MFDEAKTWHGLVPLSFTKLQEERLGMKKCTCHQKTWRRILAFTDAIWFRKLQVFTTDQPLSTAFKKTFAFLIYAKNFLWLGCFGEKSKEKTALFACIRENSARFQNIKKVNFE